MNTVAIIRIVTELVALFPTLIPAFQSAISGVKEAFDKDKVVTSTDIHNIVNKAVANHALAVSLVSTPEI
jgi:hypothetical protein